MGAKPTTAWGTAWIVFCLSSIPTDSIITNNSQIALSNLGPLRRAPDSHNTEDRYHESFSFLDISIH